MTDDKKLKEDSKNKSKDEIEIENKDLLNVFFDNSGSQFESQLFLSRKRFLNAENGQNELSDLLKSKLKALDMMLLILTNNKNILKESDISCCEVLNNLLSLSKKDKTYGEHIFSKIKTITIYLIKNKIILEEKNIEENKVIIKFLLTLYNIKFDNGYFKQTLDLISSEKDLLELFIHELFEKLFKGRNISIKVKDMKFILKSILINEKIIKYLNYFDIMELIINYAKEKQNGGCRTTFQLNQVVYLLQYMVEIININEIKKYLSDKNEQKKRLLKIIEIFYNSVKDLVNEEDYDFDLNKISKKNLLIKNENIRRKKIIFGEMLNFLNKLKKNFGIIGDKEFNQKLEDINNLYKNIINTKYVIIINSNNNNKNNEEKKNKENKKHFDEINIKTKEQNIKNDENINEEEENEKKKNDIKEDTNKIDKENKNIGYEEKDNIENEKGEDDGIELEEEPKKEKGKKRIKEKAKETKDKTEKNNKQKSGNDKMEIKNKKTKRIESEDKENNKKENKNKKKKKK